MLPGAREDSALVVIGLRPGAGPLRVAARPAAAPPDGGGAGHQRGRGGAALAAGRVHTARSSTARRRAARAAGPRPARPPGRAGASASAVGRARRRGELLDASAGGRDAAGAARGVGLEPAGAAAGGRESWVPRACRRQRRRGTPRCRAARAVRAGARPSPSSRPPGPARPGLPPARDARGRALARRALGRPSRHPGARATSSSSESVPERARPIGGYDLEGAGARALAREERLMGTELTRSAFLGERAIVGRRRTRRRRILAAHCAPERLRARISRGCGSE